ncbi:MULTISPECIES: MFS transporter [unclassified Beijerinckia]|uniref:MFS transporter n=1 Tax=unclassified Beijerinckia TaxID=2638183 RepID=UPI000896EA2D|nr:MULTISPECIES: MFS transporter [unclassified Beijerinckia]MDH7795279.1 MFS family permease [Beijerinckia sp. GAS462]SEB94965.1 Predicted arabinose efflux permease, MFS family [Beijerinckia sp. 28-YEA-48]
MKTTPTPAEPDVPWRVQLPIYLTGFFSNSLNDVAGIILPLWLHGQNASAATVGLVIGARHILPFFFAIHGGALMDRFGARRLMVWCCLLSIFAIPLFPIVVWLPGVFLLQMLNGYGSAIGWLGAQTLFGQNMRGSHKLAGRFAFILRMGSFIGPPIAGLAWDHIGVAGGFAVLTFWALGTLVSAHFAPAAPERGSGAMAHSFRFADFMPRVADYSAALRMAALPGMTIVLMITVIRIGASSVQDSFYPLYLSTIGFSATQIGVLVTVSSAVAAVGALLVGPVVRVVPPIWTLILSTAVSVIFVAATPLLTAYPALATTAALRGLGMGLSQPLMLSMLIEASGRKSQGIGAALRTTANRAAAAITPTSMGIVASVGTLAASFFLVGGVMLTGLAVISIYVRRRPHLTY